MENLHRRRSGFSRSVGARLLATGVGCSISLLAGAAGATPLEPLRPSQLTLVHWLLLVGVFLLIWVLFYWVLYPFFLRYFNPSFSKVLFWSLLLFYSLTWLHLSLYLVFDYAFFHSWVRWTAAVLTGLWLIWFLVVLLRSRRGA